MLYTEMLICGEPVSSGHPPLSGHSFISRLIEFPAFHFFRVNFLLSFKNVMK